MSKYLVSKSRMVSQSIIIAGENNLYSAEIKTQVAQHPEITCHNYLNELTRSQSPLNLAAIIYFVGFGSPSLHQTLLSTQTLYDYLQLAQSQNCRFFLIVGAESLTTTKSALLLCRQFTQVSKINSEVIQASSTEPVADTSEVILRKIIYNHHRQLIPKSLSVPRVPGPVQPKVSVKTRRSKSLKISALLVGLLLGIILAVPVASYLQLKCGLDRFQNNDFTLSEKCFTTYQTLVKFSPLQMLFPPNPVLSSQSVMELTQLTGQLSDITYQTVSALASTAPATDGYYFDLLKSLNRIQISVKSGPDSGQTGKNLSQKVSSLKSVIEKYQLVLPQLVTLLKKNQPENLLVLFRSSFAATPQGGAVVGVGLAPVSKEGIGPFKFYSARTVDSLFPGRFQSTQTYQTLTGKMYSTLADLAYEPDPQKVALSVASYVEKSLSQKVNFVISLNEKVFNELFLDAGNSRSQLALNENQLFSSGFSVSDQMNKTLNSITHVPPDKGSKLLISLLELLDQKQISFYSVDPPLLTLDLVEWSGKLQLTDCNSWFPCLHQLIYPSFYFFEPQSISTPLGSVVALGNQLGSGSLISDLSLKPNLTSGSASRTVFWLVVSNQVSVNSLNLDGKEVKPIIQKYNYSPGVTLLGYLLNYSFTAPSEILVKYSQALPADLTRLRYQLDFLSGPVLNGDMSLQINYPSNWPVVSYSVPAVASVGELRYNVPLLSNKLILDFTPK